jgi:hypothetical protein
MSSAHARLDECIETSVPLSFPSEIFGPALGVNLAATRWSQSQIVTAPRSAGYSSSMIFISDTLLCRRFLAANSAPLISNLLTATDGDVNGSRCTPESDWPRRNWSPRLAPCGDPTVHVSPGRSTTGVALMGEPHKAPRGDHPGRPQRLYLRGPTRLLEARPGRATVAVLGVPQPGGGSELRDRDIDPTYMVTYQREVVRFAHGAIVDVDDAGPTDPHGHPGVDRQERLDGERAVRVEFDPGQRIMLHHRKPPDSHQTPPAHRR